MRKITFKDKFRYWFDNTMSKGPAALIGWLFLLSAALIAVVSLIVAATGIDPEGRGFLEIAWAGLMRTLDAGTMGGDTGGWPFLASMLAVTVGGIFVVSTLIGVLTTGLEDRLEQLRQGRSFVAEQGHTAILGWSSQIFTIISELVVANANQPRPCVAILAEQDKVEMEGEIRARVGNTGRTRVVCRTGSPVDLADLEIVNPHAARSIIVLAPETEDPDATTIKTILALTNNPNRRPDPYHIVATIRDARNQDVAHMVGRGEAQIVLASDLAARVTAQTCRQSGLSVVYTELLNFGGDEIYFKQEPGLAGKTFGEALLAYEDSALIGLRFEGGRIQLNPPMDTRIGQGDQVIAISADDDTVRLSGQAEVALEAGAIREALPRPAVPERTLILGWNQHAPTIIKELDNYVGPGSQVTVVAQDCHAEEVAATVLEAGGTPETRRYRNLAVDFHGGDTNDRRVLDDLAPHTYSHVVVLSYSGTLDPQQADARTLVTLLHLRDVAEQCGRAFSIVSEMLDVRNRALAAVTRADDFIVSDELISLMLSQISENKELAAVFQDLFDPEGSELYLKPAEDYVELGRPLNFYTVVEAARQRGEVAIGYRHHAQAHDSARSYGVRVNPPKSVPVTFSREDRVIVLAES